MSAAWQAASQEQRRALLDRLGRAGLCAVMSPTLLADFRDHVVGLNIAGASDSSRFSVYSTNLLHSALACAEQPDDENVKRVVAMLGLIIKKAEAKGIARSAIVIAEGKKGRN
jgi:hypothetical protein